RGRLRLGASVTPQLQILALAVEADRARDTALAIAAERRTGAVGERAVVLDEALERLPGQVEAVEGGVAALEPGDDPQRLGIVVEAAMLGEHLIERALPRMAERRMAEIVRQRQGLGEILVEAERARQRAGNLRHLQRVRQPGAVMIPFV